VRRVAVDERGIVNDDIRVGRALNRVATAFETSGGGIVALRSRQPAATRGGSSSSRITFQGPARTRRRPPCTGGKPVLARRPGPVSDPIRTAASLDLWVCEFGLACQRRRRRVSSSPIGDLDRLRLGCPGRRRNLSDSSAERVVHPQKAALTIADVQLPGVATEARECRFVAAASSL
jgi:hypothetical protein